MKKKYKIFLLYVLLFTVIFSIPVLLDVLFVYNAGENSGFDEIIKLQKSKDAIYGTELNQNTFLYKLEMVREKKPEIIALGSSRVLQFREEYFKQSFVNCGGAMHYLKEGVLFIKEMVKFYKPDVIIMGLDYWWFNEDYLQPSGFSHHQNNGKTLTLEKLTTPIDLIYKGIISFKDFIDILICKYPENIVSDNYSIGLQAIKMQGGFRKDGSYFYSGYIFGLKKSDVKFTETLRGIDNGLLFFKHGKNLSSKSIQMFEEIVDLCKKNNIRLVCFVAPLSYTAYLKMLSMSDKYIYVKKFQNYLMASSNETYDFLNIESVGSNDCECVDGFHGGEVTYQRILLKIMEINPNSLLKDYINVNLLKASIKESSGKALSAIDNRKYKMKELDFLELGCKK